MVIDTIIIDIFPHSFEWYSQILKKSFYSKISYPLSKEFKCFNMNSRRLRDLISIQ
jgi:hypothetical protein